jgi:hypothetical protein
LVTEILFNTMSVVHGLSTRHSNISTPLQGEHNYDKYHSGFHR